MNTKQGKSASEYRFTPGPWRHELTQIAYVFGGDGARVARLEGMPLAQAEANARLIAAAPTMYDEMKTQAIALNILGGQIYREIELLEQAGGRSTFTTERLLALRRFYDSTRGAELALRDALAMASGN